jgi:hypothetical protein
MGAVMARRIYFTNYLEHFINLLFFELAIQFLLYVGQRI